MWVCLKETNQRPDRSFADKCVRVQQVKVIGAALILCNPKREIVAVRKAAIPRRSYESHPGGPGVLLYCFFNRRRIARRIVDDNHPNTDPVARRSLRID